MISTFFLSIFSGFVGLLVALLPTGSLPTSIATAFAYFVGVVNAFSYVVPIDTLIQAVLVVLAFDGALLLWRVINWIIRKIPGMQ